MKRWGLLLFGGWATVTFGLFLATVAGRLAETYLSVVGDGRQAIQAIVMSVIVIPIIMYLYKKLYQRVDKLEKPALSLAGVLHILTGFIFAVVLAIVGLLTMNGFDWIVLEQWHSPSTWISALLINMLIAFFYEALPEEIAMRGFVYDTLRHKLSVWQSVLVQAFIFLAFSAGVTLLQVMVGMASPESIVALIPALILHFFFAIALALMRVWTGSLWASIGFHLGYLMMARFLIMPDEYGAPPIMTFQDKIIDGVGAIYSIMIVILGTIIFLLIWLGINRKRNMMDSK